MIQICPAILVDKVEDLKTQLEQYIPMFDQIDIDVNIEHDDFEGKVLVLPGNVYSVILNLFQDISVKPTIALHFMVSNPLPYIVLWHNVIGQSIPIKFYIHQEAMYKQVLESDLFEKYEINMSVKIESDMKPIEFYNQFNEIQLMSIEAGAQGNSFIPEVLERVEWLRENGYDKKISLDGGVNLKTASVLRETTINRVSVGSYFAKSTDLQMDKMKLELALNM